jgi:hypothetical protein
MGSQAVTRRAGTIEQSHVQRTLDRLAVSGSVLCLLHCLATPLLLVALPVLSSTVVADEAFHRLILVFVLPVSLVALLIGCRHHKDPVVMGFGGVGLLSLILVAFFGYDLLGEAGERAATVASGLALAIGHLRNYRLCRDDDCTN